MITKYLFLLFLVVWTPHALGQAIRSKNVIHTQAYKPRPERGQHIDIKVTPPGRRGSDGKVLVEVYNRSKQHLSLIQFDISLNNRGGFSINAPGKAEDLKPNLSGSQWVKIPKVNGAFPDIDEAIVTNLRCLTVDAHEVTIKGFVDLIKK